MKTISIKILKENNKGHSRVDHVLNEFSHVLDNGVQYSINYHESLSQEDIKQALISEYGEDISIQDTAYHGCYGASSGQVLEGFKVYIDSSLFSERFIDSDFDEIINIEQLCNEYGTLLDIDAEAFRDSAFALLGSDGKSDNTYNYLGHNSHDPVPLCHANFTVFESQVDEKVFIITKFHCGGDIRGNYSSEVVYEFSDIYEAYNAFNPSLQLIDEENLDEIERLKDLISRDPADKELLIKELKELL